MEMAKDERRKGMSYQYLIEWQRQHRLLLIYISVVVTVVLVLFLLEYA